MKLDKKKVEIAMARACMSYTELSEAAGIGPKNLRTTLGKSDSRPVTVGRIARALGVDVLEILADE